MSSGQTPACTSRLFFLLFLLAGALQQSLAARPLLVFLIDGFRYDYMDDLQVLPGFRELVENGVKVDYLTPDFPSLSYPNYYSLMTGKLTRSVSQALLDLGLKEILDLHVCHSWHALKVFDFLCFISAADTDTAWQVFNARESTVYRTCLCFHINSTPVDVSQHWLELVTV